MEDKYSIIYNPSRWYNKYELWISGIVSTSDSKGYMVDKYSVRVFKVFRSEERALAEIKYQQEVAGLMKEMK